MEQYDRKSDAASFSFAPENVSYEIDDRGRVIVHPRQHARHIDDLQDELVPASLEFLKGMSRELGDGLILVNPDPERWAMVMRLVALKVVRIHALKDGRIVVSRRRQKYRWPK